MKRRTMIRSLFIVSFIALVSQQASSAAEEPGNVLSSEKDPRAVVEFLRKIIDGRNKADASAKNMLIKGWVSRVSVAWKPDIELPSPATIPPPEWRAFSLVQRGAKRRFEMEYMQQIGKEDVQETVYRLADGESFYKLDGNALEILGNKEGQRSWEVLAYEYYTFGQVHDGRSYKPLMDGCQTLIDRMTKEIDRKFWQQRVLRCSVDGELLLVDNDDKVIDKSRYRYRFWVDPNKGYRVVKVVNQMGGPSRGADIREESQVELREAIPGVFINQKGTTFIANLGTVAKRDGRAGWLKGDMEVTEVAVEDFQYDDKLFDWHTLPIPNGAHVTDRRSDPELVFNHGKSPLNEESLRSGLSHPPLRQRRIWLLVGGLSALFAFAILLVFRYRWRKHAGPAGSKETF